MISVCKNGAFGVSPNKKCACITKCVSCDVQKCTSGEKKKEKFVDGKKRRGNLVASKREILAYRGAAISQYFFAIF